MSLQSSPLVYLFLETSILPAQRTFFESVLELPLIEIEPHMPHHRHGVTKYDAGKVVLSLNLTGPSRFTKTESDALTTVLVEAGGVASAVDRLRAAPELGVVRDEPSSALFTDCNGHHFRFVDEDARTETRESSPIVARFHLAIADLAASLEFYVGRLGLALIERDHRRALLATGSIDLELEERKTAVDGRRPRTATSLIVFHTTDIEGTTYALVERGVAFRSHHAGFSEIGGTIRFDDPTGNRLCLYQPSDESLTWGSGPKVLQIVAGRAVAG